MVVISVCNFSQRPSVPALQPTGKRARALLENYQPRDAETKCRSNFQPLYGVHNSHTLISQVSSTVYRLLLDRLRSTFLRAHRSLAEFVFLHTLDN